MKKFAAAMTLLGALAPALYALPAKAGDCWGCGRSTVSVTYKPVIRHFVTYKPVVHSYLSYLPVYHRRFHHHCCCYCCGHVSAYPDVQDSYVVTYN